MQQFTRRLIPDADELICGGEEMDRREAERVIRRVEEIPTLPVIITRILQVLGDGKSSAMDLEKVISLDQSISAKVLKIANSAYYGFPGSINTLHRAIVILGFQTVKGLSLGSFIFDTFFSAGKHVSFDRTAYWLHSIASSRCAMALGAELKELDIEEAFLGGLLHDIGKVVMDHVMHDEYSRVLRKAIQQKGAIDQLEREAWGFDHGDVGAWVGERWKFPQSLLDGIRFHHKVTESQDSKRMLVAAIHLADFCANEAGLGVVENTHRTPLQEEALSLTRFTEENLTALTDRLSHERGEIEGFFSVMSSSPGGSDGEGIEKENP